MSAGIAATSAQRRPRIVVGNGSIARLADELERIGARRPVIVCGRSTAQDPTVRDALAQALRGLSCEVVDGVRPDVPLDSVRDIADAVLRFGADALVAIGGGAAITTTRAVNILAHEESEPTALSTRIDADGRVTSPRLRGPRLPQIVIPTTPTTAAPKAGAAFTVEGSRHALYDPRTRATSLVVDADLAARVPPVTVLSATLNAYVMALEGWLSHRRHPIADVMLRGAAGELSDALTAAVLGQPYQAERLTIAAVAVGEATDVTGGGMTAALSHTIGPLVRAPNGILDALLVPHVVAAAAEPEHDRLDQLGRVLGSNVLEVVSEALALAAFSRLRDVGLPADSLDAVARDSLGDVSAWADPRPNPVARARRILDAAW